MCRSTQADPRLEFTLRAIKNNSSFSSCSSSSDARAHNGQDQSEVVHRFVQLSDSNRSGFGSTIGSTHPGNRKYQLNAVMSFKSRENAKSLSMITGDPGVGIYVDGVYYGRSQGGIMA